MTLHRDHVVGGALLAIAVLALALSGDLPIGTLSSPGPGMMPSLAIALIGVFAVTLIATARSGPVAATVTWSDLPKAAIVAVIAAAGVALYEALGFVLAMALLIFTLLTLVEGVAVGKAALYAAGVTLGVKLLLSSVMRSPLPLGPFGF